jgi:phage terminase large subunit GpA-like protein
VSADVESQPAQFVFEDEKDLYPKDLAGQGSPSDQARARQDQFGNRRKSLHTSTSSVKGESAIEADYDNCDERKEYFMPCPECGHEQTLRWSNFRWNEKISREIICRSGTVTSGDAVRCPEMRRR